VIRVVISSATIARLTRQYDAQISGCLDECLVMQGDAVPSSRREIAKQQLEPRDLIGVEVVKAD
jgi:hypothetical protein